MNIWAGEQPQGHRVDAAPDWSRAGSLAEARPPERVRIHWSGDPLVPLPARNIGQSPLTGGTISVAESVETVASLGGEVALESAKEMTTEMDVTGDQELSYGEFTEMVGAFWV